LKSDLITSSTAVFWATILRGGRFPFEELGHPLHFVPGLVSQGRLADPAIFDVALIGACPNGAAVDGQGL